MTPWKIEKITSSDPKLKIRVGSFTHPNVEEEEIDQTVFFSREEESGLKSTQTWLKSFQFLETSDL